MEETRYADTFIYVPSVREIVRIAKGNGTNLLDDISKRIICQSMCEWV